MKWLVLAAGKPSLPFVRDGVAEYEKRLRRFCPFELRALKAPDADAYRKAAGDSLRIVLDERGSALSTRALTEQVNAWELQAVREISVWIGPSDGFGADVRNEAHLLLQLGTITLMHELALLVWMEQLYRIYTVKAGFPYHRD